MGTNELLQTKPRVPKTRRVREEEAVHAFLHRGKLLGLTRQEREQRLKARKRTDHTAAWLEGRAELIADRKRVLDELIQQWNEEQKDKDEEQRAREAEQGESKLEGSIRRLRQEISDLSAPVLAASHGYQFAYGQYLKKAVDLVNDDIRIVPLMTNTTADTERDAVDTVSDFTTLDEFNGANYSTGGLALDTQAVNIDDANDRAEFDAADETVTALGAGTRSIDGILLISFVTNLNSSLPLHWIDFSTDKTPDGSDFVFQFNAEGILQAADG